MNHVLIRWTLFNIQRDDRERRGGKGHSHEIVWAYIRAPEENTTGGHCHKIANCSGNKKFMITVM